MSTIRLSKEEQDIKIILEDYLKKLTSNTLSYDEKMNVVEFYIQDKTIKKSEQIRQNLVDWVRSVIDTNEHITDLLYTTFSDYFNY